MYAGKAGMMACNNNKLYNPMDMGYTFCYCCMPLPTAPCLLDIWYSHPYMCQHFQKMFI